MWFAFVCETITARAAPYTVLFALASGWLFQRHIDHERERAESVQTDRMGAWAELIQRSLERTQGNKGQAARLLHLKRTTLVEKLCKALRER